MNELRKNYLNLVVYQVYPRSFCDTNGDGIGDLNGVTSKLDYLKDLGINAIWLSPCFKSPNCDNGYDISDYCDIMDEFGTLDDIKRLISEAHKREIKIFLDYVANHTSSEHKWFKEGRLSKESPYHDYYIWADKPLNDWRACFGGSVWEYNEPTNEYYLHSFAIGQPDLNWSNPKVRKEMCNVVDFWVNLGVDGFRCDAFDCIGKDFEHNISAGAPIMHEYIREVFGRKEVENIFTVGECWTTEEGIYNICGEDRKELTCIFQFDHFQIGREGRFIEKPYKVDQIRDVLVKWQGIADKLNIIYTLFTDNHDQPHYIARLGNDKKYRYECATCYATMFYCLKGIPFIYQGQEFGTPDPKGYKFATDYDDIETVNYYKEMHGKMDEKELIAQMNFGSRDNARRPICWSSGENFGFGGKPWIAPHTRGREVNLEKDLKSKKSVHDFFKNLIAFRKSSETVKFGEFINKTNGNGHFAYARKGENEEILVVCNFENKIKIDYLEENGFTYLFGNGKKDRTVNGKYSPFECAVFFRKI